MKITYTNEQTHSRHQELIDGLVKNNKESGPLENWEWVSFYAEDEKGDLAGGVQGIFEWDFLSIKRLWVADNYKKQGLGTRLLNEAENFARKKQKKGVWLDTFDFQARPFYEKNGYLVFGKINNAADKHSRYFLVKEFS